MTFKVSRTSEWGFKKNNPPCKNAVPAVEEYYDYWNATTRKRDIWTIEINTLEELMERKKEVNEDDQQVGLIIFDDKIPSIEIYDDYRE